VLLGAGAAVVAGKKQNPVGSLKTKKCLSRSLGLDCRYDHSQFLLVAVREFDLWDSVACEMMVPAYVLLRSVARAAFISIVFRYRLFLCIPP